MAVKPQMNAGILPAKRETDKATPVKVWGFTFSIKKSIKVEDVKIRTDIVNTSL